MNYLQISTSTGSREEAEKIAEGLVEKRLAACVQVLGPVTSFYRWEGKKERGEEWLCLIKTTKERGDEVEAAIKEMHSYELPEIIALPILEGSSEYLGWLEDQVA